MHYTPPQSTAWTKEQAESFLALPDETLKIAITQFFDLGVRGSYEELMAKTNIILANGKANFNNPEFQKKYQKMTPALIELFRENLKKFIEEKR